MPYITQENRKLYKDDLDELCFALEEQGYPKGDVTYVLYVILARWFKHLPGYSAIADIRGCLAGTLSELDRRFFFQYEDKKIKENGDVDLSYPPLEGVMYEGMCLRPGCAGPRDCPCQDERLSRPADKTLEAPSLVDPLGEPTFAELFEGIGGCEHLCSSVEACEICNDTRGGA